MRRWLWHLRRLTEILTNISDRLEKLEERDQHQPAHLPDSSEVKAGCYRGLGEVRVLTVNPGPAGDPDAAWGRSPDAPPPTNLGAYL